MTDRTQSSVRTGSWPGDAPASADTTAEPSSSTTQAIPGTGTQRAQAAGGAPAVPPSSGLPTGSVPAGTPSAGGGILGGSSSAPEAATPRVTSRGRGSGKPGGRGPRRARLQLRHIDTWSALKISLVLSIALFFIWMVAVGILYMVLNGLGVFDTLNDLFGQVGSVSKAKGTASPVITPGVVFGGAAIIGAINIVLMTALCTVGTFIYNLCSDLVGGLEITLSERD
jgi:hypothetical protein